MSRQQNIHDYDSFGTKITAEEIKGYYNLRFKPEELRLIDSISLQIKELKEEYPILSQADLVIEGGVGSEDVMREIVRVIYPYPKALYAGMDLNSIWERMHGPRYKLMVDENRAQQLSEANRTSIPAFSYDEKICANCFDYSLVKDLSHKLGRHFPLLVSFNALGALSDPYNWGPDEDRDVKKPEDSHPLEHWFSKDSPYIAQIHFSHEPIRFKNVFTNEMNLRFQFEDLCSCARRFNLQIAEVKNGLVIFGYNSGL
ncbi:MAG: hypothetical protein V1858_03490 [Candidatus Gottesmanbacteria bacterium]